MEWKDFNKNKISHVKSFKPKKRYKYNIVGICHCKFNYDSS